MATSDSLRLPQGGDLDLLLVGKSGNGKTSAGNAILGRKTFTNLGEEKTYQVGYSDVDGRVIKVVDVLGFCNHHACSEDAANIFTDALSKAIGQFINGFNAIVFVMSLTTKFSQKEEKIVQALKEILGDDVMKKYGVCLMTHGDALNDKTTHTDDDNVKGEKDDHEVFLKWCKSRSGSLGEMFEECEYRCVAFDNATHDEVCQTRQRLELVRLVDKIGEKNSVYTLESFIKSQEEMAKKENKSDCCDGVDGCKLPIVLETVSRETDLIRQAVLKFKEYKQRKHSRDIMENDQIDSTSSCRVLLNPTKIKKKSESLLHEIYHVDPEKLAELKPELEQIRKIMAECENKDGNFIDNEDVNNIASKHRGSESEQDECLHQTRQCVHHDDDEHQEKSDQHHNDKHADNDHILHDNNHYKIHHNDQHNSASSLLDNSASPGVDDEDYGIKFDTNSLDDDKLNLILESTENVKVKVEEIRDAEEGYYSWISSSVTSPINHLINSTFPSIVEGIVEATDFILDTIFDL